MSNLKNTGREVKKDAGSLLAEVMTLVASVAIAIGAGYVGVLIFGGKVEGEGTMKIAGQTFGDKDGGIFISVGIAAFFWVNI
jgi:hypothetical protein